MNYPLPITSSTLKDFFEHRVRFRPDEFSAEIEQSWADRMCFLVVANGGLGVGSYGCIGFDGIHQRGLSYEDAMWLTVEGGFMRGVAAAGVQIMEAFETQYLRPYLDRIRARQDAAHAETAKSTPNSQETPT